ncbi:MAG: GTP-binding protein [Elainellaceae cyanobacterium]
MTSSPPSQPSPDSSESFSSATNRGRSQADAYVNRARASLKQAIARYSKQLQLQRAHPEAAQRQVALKRDLDQLHTSLDKLNDSIVRIAVFGLVSQGKSALINALTGQKLLQTGPLHGVTQWPRSVYWTWAEAADLNVELIDTPGLEEVNGDERASMATTVAQQSDLILFVISGDLTRTEYDALATLRSLHKPLLVVFNKIDLYPNQDREAIADNLNTLLEGRITPLAIQDVVRVSAEPAPLQVRTDWPDGRTTYEWETPPPQVDELRQRLATLLHHEGKLLLALNVLRESRTIEIDIAQKTLDLYADDAEELIWKFASWKGIAVAANPIAIFDLMGGAAADLVMIRALARLYGLPMTGYEAGKLWNSIIWSSLSLLAGELGSGLLLGFGKSAAAITSAFESATGIAAYSTTAIAQASLAGYGAYRIGKAAQLYLEQGCSWGPKGTSTVLQDILSQLDDSAVTERLRQEIIETSVGHSPSDASSQQI